MNAEWDRTALHLSAYVMWRLNWIHPFSGGNGRTSRAVSYLVMCARLGYRVPGTATILEQIVNNRQPYYEALDAADAAWGDRIIDLSAMEGLLEHALAVQLSSVLEAAGSLGQGRTGARLTAPKTCQVHGAEEALSTVV